MSRYSCGFDGLYWIPGRAGDGDVWVPHPLEWVNYYVRFLALHRNPTYITIALIIKKGLYVNNELIILGIMSELKWHIREAVIEDSTGLKKCMVLAYSEYLERMGGVRLPPMDVDYEDEIKNYPVWVAEMGKEIVGGLILVKEQEYFSIANVAVNPE